MFKKHMTPLQPHKKAGSLHSTVNKASSARNLPGAATGGGPASFQSYAKATPMMQPDDGDSPDGDSQGLGTGSFPGNITG